MRRFFRDIRPNALEWSLVIALMVIAALAMATWLRSHDLACHTGTLYVDDAADAIPAR